MVIKKRDKEWIPRISLRHRASLWKWTFYLLIYPFHFYYIMR